MKQSPPLFLRLTLTLMAIIGAAGVCYLLFNADKYLASGGRWLALGGGTVLATVVIGLGFRWRELAAYLVLTSVLLPVGLYGAEMILRFVLSPTVVADLGADETSRAAAMIRSAEASGDRLRPDVGVFKPALFSRDAAGRLRSRLSARGTEAIKLGGLSNTLTLTYDPVARDWNKFTTDRHGHINDDTIWDRGGVDVLVVGASHTTGGGARFGRDFVSLLKGPNRVVARLALGGIGGLSKLGMIREFGPLLKPRTVFWVYADRNDLEADLEREFNIPLLTRYLDPDFRQELPVHEAELGPALDVLIMELLARHERQLQAGPQPRAGPSFDWKGLAKLGRLRQRLGITFGTPVSKAQLSGWAKIMAMAKHDAAAWGGRLVLVYLPMSTTLLTGNDDPFKYHVLKVLHDLDIPMVDISDDLLALDDPSDLFRTEAGGWGGHYNEDGHRRLAQRLERFLQRKAVAD